MHSTFERSANVSVGETTRTTTTKPSVRVAAASQASPLASIIECAFTRARERSAIDCACGIVGAICVPRLTNVTHDPEDHARHRGGKHPALRHTRATADTQEGCTRAHIARRREACTFTRDSAIFGVLADVFLLPPRARLTDNKR